jgi:HK97 family phage major capsid protein
MRYSVADILGSATNWRTAEIDLLCKMFISETEPEVKAKIKEKIIDSVSLGYMTDPQRTVEIPKNATVIIDGVEYKNEFEDDIPLLVRLWWKVKEVSLVAIGADDAAKIKRNLQSGIKSSDPELQKMLDTILANQKSLEDKITINQPKGGSKMADERTPEQLLREERERVSAIEKMAERFSGNISNMAQLKAEAIQTGVSEDQFSNILLKNFNENKPLETPIGDVDLTKSDLEKYSLMKALNAQLTNNWKDAGLEKEVSNAIAKKTDRPAQGIYVPQQILNKGILNSLAMNTRTGSMTTTNAADIIKTELADNMWIALLRNKMVTRQAGAKVLSGLNGNLDIPKQLTPGTFHWVGEQGTGTQTNLTVSKLSLTPKDGWAQQIYGRRTFLQTSPSIEAMMLEDLNTLAALGLDYAGLMGPGTNSPTGIAHTNSVGSVAFASAGVLTWDKIVEFETDVEVSNADVPSMAFVTNPRVKGKGKTTLKTSGVSGYIMEGKEMNGYPVLVTNQVDAGYMIFGDFSQLIYAEWGLIDILVNPYADNADVKLTLFVTADVGVRQPGAFSVSTNAEA